MRQIVWLFCLVLFSCSSNQINKDNQVELVESEIDSISVISEENLREEKNPNETFLIFYKKLTTAVSTKNQEEFNSCINANFGLNIIESHGAMPEMSKIYAIEKFKSTSGNFFEVTFSKIEIEPIFEFLPKVICDVEVYDKQGCFAQEVNPLIESQIWNYAGLNEKEIQAIAFLAETINITVINTSNFTFYFSKIEGKWYLTFLDLRVPCTA